MEQIRQFGRRGVEESGNRQETEFNESMLPVYIRERDKDSRMNDLLTERDTLVATMQQPDTAVREDSTRLQQIEASIHQRYREILNERS